MLTRQIAEMDLALHEAKWCEFGRKHYLKREIRRLKKEYWAQVAKNRKG